MPAAAVEVVDDRGVTVVLPTPARRIVTLAPHLTELLFAAGAGDRLVGTVAYSDFPAAARAVPRVGDSGSLDLERLLALRPELVVVWRGGTSKAQLDLLAGLGVPLYHDAPRTLADIARSIERLGALAGTDTAAAAAASAYRTRLAALGARHAGAAPVTVFHQVWDRPLMTVGGGHLISQAIALCGGRNVFDGLRAAAPGVSMEAVLDADPEVIGSTGAGGPAEAGMRAWLDWPRLRAVARGNLYVLPPELISQPVPRLLDGIEQLCAALDTARSRRPH